MSFIQIPYTLAFLLFLFLVLYMYMYMYVFFPEQLELFADMMRFMLKYFPVYFLNIRIFSFITTVQ